MDIFDESMFMPHGHCFLWIRELLFLHVGSDLLIAAAYFTIPVSLFYFMRKRPDIEFRPVFAMFAMFIMACGVTHVFNAWNIWRSDYWASGAAKLVTAMVSMLTAIYLWKLIPVALKFPSPSQLRIANEGLERENALRQEALRSLRENGKLLSAAFDNAPIGKALAGPGGNWLKVNQSLCRIVGYSEFELLETNFQTITFPEDLGHVQQCIHELMDGARHGYELEKRLVHKHGHLVWVLMNITLVSDENGDPQFIIFQIQDITGRKRAEENLKQINTELEARVAERTEKLAQLNRELAQTNQRLELLARSDHLSGLYNRRYLVELLGKAIHAASRYHVDLCLIMVDIDHFKHINDNHGHIIGDRVIAAIGAQIKSCIRDTDIAARIGGDEFCVGVIADHARTLKIAEKLRAGIAGLNIAGKDGEPLVVTGSFGVCAWHEAITSPGQLIDAADQALYQAKTTGRDKVMSFPPGQ